MTTNKSSGKNAAPMVSEELPAISQPGLSFRAARTFAAANLVSSIVIFLGVFRGLPARWWPVDVPAAVLILLLATSSFALFRQHPQAERLARLASGVALTCGLLLVLLLVASASWIAGLYGPVGRGGALVLALVALLVLPYLVVLPAVELVFLGRPNGPSKPSGA